MTKFLGNIVILALIVGLVESGLDVSGVAASDDSAGVAHEIHGHLGLDDDSPVGDDVDVEHFCHCVTHGAALSFSVNYLVDKTESTRVVFQSIAYRSLTTPPPVPPPNA